MSKAETQTVVQWRGKELLLRVGEVVKLDGWPYLVEYEEKCGGIVLSSINRPTGSRRPARVLMDVE